MLIGVYICSAYRARESEPRIVSDPMGDTDRLLKPQPPTAGTPLQFDSGTLVYIALSETFIAPEVSISPYLFSVSSV